MVTPLPVPLDREGDARQRAWRTFVQGLALDVAIAVVLAVLPLVGDVEWTRTYWLALAALAGRSAVAAGVAYVARKLVPPGGAGGSRG